MKNLFVENQPGRNRHVPAATFATARPLAEGAAQPAARQKRREWSRMDNDAVIACASGTIRKKGITSITGLENEDSGLVRIIRLRGIEGMLPLGLKRADWKGAGDDELLAKARALMAERGIKTSSDFRRAEPKLHCALAHRRLLGKAGFAAAYRDWGAMSPDEIVSHAAAFMKERGIRIQAELRKADYGLWNALNRRKLLGRMPFEPGRREWGKVGHDELAAAASEFMES